ncbi:hypothetical protein Tco_1267786, partial [Tanacetum coccineum]
VVAWRKRQGGGGEMVMMVWWCVVMGRWRGVAAVVMEMKVMVA